MHADRTTGCRSVVVRMQAPDKFSRQTEMENMQQLSIYKLKEDSKVETHKRCKTELCTE